MGENIADFVRKQWDGDPKKKYVPLGELVKVRYKGYDITIADIVAKMENGKNSNNLPLIAIIKKRAAYQRYLENRKKKQENNFANIEYSDIKYPKVHFPKIMLKS